ncbi:MAG TPA: VIT domain-containing protein [Candidatus Binatia bacterium]|jgi:Ca-activated chloride channel family protein|nr:VIT domain-containing protein [Candidatus Binatia bacterium]
MKRLICCSVLLALLGALSPARAAGLILVEDSSWWPGPNPPHPMPPPWQPRPFPPRYQPHLFAPLEVNSVRVNTRITDQIAVTAVDQEFYNPNPTRLEGTFVFPIPKGAHLDKFKMDIDGRPVEAELLSADKARHIYEDIVRKLKDPALLEYAGRDVFKVRIFPIEPNSKKHIHLSYTQLLRADEGLISYVLPLNTEKFSCRPIKSVSVKVELESPRALKSIYSPSHSVEVRREGPNRATVGYEASEAQPDADFALYFAPEKDELGVNLLAHKSSGEDGYFLLLASPGVDVKEKQVILKDVVFVLDTSGSMAGKKLDQAKKALDFCLENLNDGDRFEILRFSTEVEPLFNKLMEASRQNRAQAESFVKDLKPIGATAIDEALRQALNLQSRRLEAKEAPGKESAVSTSRPFVVIFLTDGQPTIGTTDPDQIVSNVKRNTDGRTRIFCFGIGTDVNTHLLDKITEETRAFSQYVLPEEDLEVKVSSFFSKIKEPVLANPTLEFTGGIHASKLYPSPLPDLFKGEQLVLVGRYSGHGDSAVVVEGAVNGATRKFTFEVKFPEDSSDNDFIPRLWATRRVGYLLDEIRLHGENSELRDEVTELARKYGIVTPYTAYLIVEDETRRQVPAAVRSLQQFDKDSGARGEAVQAWNSFRLDAVGETGVAGARSGLALKSANAPGLATAGGAMAYEHAYGLRAPDGRAQAALADDSKARLVQYSQQSQFVSGRTFFQNEKQWIDAAVQKAAKANRVRLQFGSSEYFDFLASHPKASAWLALGQNVQFVLENTVYEIYE